MRRDSIVARFVSFRNLTQLDIARDIDSPIHARRFCVSVNVGGAIRESRNLARRDAFKRFRLLRQTLA